MASETTYDVFLSHATPDKPEVEELARRLKRRKLKPFLDKWHLVPGEPWQEALEEALKQSRAFVVFLGPSGIRPWQNEEMRAALAIRVREKNRRVIPVLLPGASMPDEEDLPPFLARLTWVDFRGGLDDPETVRRLVRAIKGLPPGDGPPPAHPQPPPTRPAMIGIPHRNPFFTGREDLLFHLHQQLQTQGISVLAQAAIYGLGGIGKTQTAIEYVHRFGSHYQYVLWVVAESEAALRTDYLSIAHELGLVEAQTDLPTAVLAMKSWLTREEGWLLVFDNADDPALVRFYLPPARKGGKVLLTSRAKSFAKVGIREPYRIETLKPEDATKFLLERAGNLDAQGATELAAELGYLPLALEHAAAYVETVGGGFSDYLVRYRRQGVALLTKGELSTEYSLNVATTWTMSFEAVREASPASADLLIAAAFLESDSIPIEIFTKGGQKLGGRLGRQLKGADSDPFVFWELFAPLEHYSLVERLPDDAFRMHRLTQEVIKASLGEMGRRAWAERVVRALNEMYPRVQHPATPQSMAHLALILRALGDLAKARRLHEQSLEVKDSLRGARPASLHVSRRMANFKTLQEQVLNIQERVLGGEHPTSLDSRNKLAETLRDLGDYAGAEKLLIQNLQSYERVLGIEHRKTIKSRNKLAETFEVLGDHASARALQEQNLKIYERVLGVEHHTTLIWRSKLAETLRALGDHASARNLQEQNLQIYERVLGVEHHTTLIWRSKLAETLRALGDHASARNLQEQNLQIYERVLGVEDHTTLFWRNQLAETLRALGDHASARNLQEQNLEIYERSLGSEHFVIAFATYNLLQTVRDLADLEAEVYLMGKLRRLLAGDSIPSGLKDLIQFKLLSMHRADDCNDPF